jgi:hypothetical protein
MELSAQLVMTAVIATAEFCANPFEGGVDEPQFCRLNAGQEISTPFFSVVVEPEFLVGVDREGRRLYLQPSSRQSQVHMKIEVVGGSDSPEWSDCPEIVKTTEEDVTWRTCRISGEGMHERRLAARLKGGHVLIEYSYSSLGAIFAPALERMTQSIRIHAI